MISCGLGAKICGYDKKEVLQIGVGMIPRGEVALVIASKGMKMGVMNNYFSGPIIIMVVVCAISAPMLLKAAFFKAVIKILQSKIFCIKCPLIVDIFSM